MIKTVCDLQRLKYLITLGLLVLFAGCMPESPPIYEHHGQTMGTQYSVKWLGDGKVDTKIIVEKIEQRLYEINQAVSTYIDDSELSRFNRLSAGGESVISRHFARNMKRALTIAELTEGAFDFTVGPLVNLWGFGPPGEAVNRPNQAAITIALAQLGYQNISFDSEASILRKQIHTEIDLSAIAKGDAVDVLAAMLEEQGIIDYLVEIGGELRAKGTKPEGMAWRAGIEIPQNQGRSIQMVLVLDDISVATSGDYRNYFEQDGMRYSHTIDPKNGYPVTHQLASVTVLDKSCARADALATALMVMGPDKGIQFATEQSLAAYFLIRKGDGFDARWSEAFEPYRPTH